MINRFRCACFGLIAALAVVMGSAGYGTAAAAPATGGERFEVSSIKAVRPTLVATIAALQKRDIASAKKAFEGYDSAWNGVEVYISTRNKDMYDSIEHYYQARITKALDGTNPDLASVLSDAQMMLAKFDDAIGMVASAMPLNPLYDDVARLRIARAPLREVAPALKIGDLAKARSSFKAFEERLNGVGDLIRARSSEAYGAITSSASQTEQSLASGKPDPDQAAMMVKGLTDQYNAVLAQVAKDARGG